MLNPGDGESERSAEAGSKWKTEEEKEKVRGSEETETRAGQRTKALGMWSKWTGKKRVFISSVSGNVVFPFMVFEKNSQVVTVGGGVGGTMFPWQQQCFKGGPQGSWLTPATDIHRPAVRLGLARKN